LEQSRHPTRYELVRHVQQEYPDVAFRKLKPRDGMASGRGEPTGEAKPE